ncbi:alpha/beta fold hydrolase [Shewanella sp. N2AIL]|uniref:alpha/beta fold hydrolase n=1 Tax=Shewanella TaxID=22 RepID=UPI00190148E7|nr:MULTISPECIES: alpha/beta fold hydrolase [Shewanella]MCI2964378.1 alpha/beta fold hydrolase [Shewanella sp. N2AIL]
MPESVLESFPPFIRRDWFSVGNGQQLHLAQYGNPQGIPLLYLHGGPGAGCDIGDLALFNGDQYWILLLDQRGSGQSLPFGDLAHNHLNGLICDMEAIRLALGIERWCLAGGSFGATLGLIYSGLFPERVIAQVLWALFIPSKEGIDWLYGADGAATLQPAAYRLFSGNASVAPSLTELLDSYHQGLASADENLRHHFARRWVQWELKLAGARLVLPRQLPDPVLALADIELHFARHAYFNAMSVLQRVTPRVKARSVLLQGMQDAICPAALLRDFLAGLEHAITIQSVADGGHMLNSESLFLAVTAEIHAMWSWIHQREIQ